MQSISKLAAGCTVILCGAFISSPFISSPLCAQYKPTVGQPHPDFALPQIGTDNPVRLSDFRGKKVLLIHFASW